MGKHSPLGSSLGRGHGVGGEVHELASQLGSPPTQSCFHPFLPQAWVPNKYLAPQTHLSFCFWRTQPVTEVMLDLFYLFAFFHLICIEKDFEATSGEVT